MRLPPVRRSTGYQVATHVSSALDTSSHNKVDKSSNSVSDVPMPSNGALSAAYLLDVAGRRGVAVASILATAATVIIPPCAVNVGRRQRGGHHPRGDGGVDGASGGGDDDGGGVGDAGRDGGRVVSASSTLVSAFAASLLLWSLMHPRALAVPSPSPLMTAPPLSPDPVGPVPVPMHATTATVAPFGIGGGLPLLLTEVFTRRDVRTVASDRNVMVAKFAPLNFHDDERESRTVLVHTAPMTTSARSLTVTVSPRRPRSTPPSVRPAPIHITIVITITLGISTAGLRCDLAGDCE